MATLILLVHLFPSPLSAQCTTPIVFSGGTWDYTNWGGATPIDPVDCDVVIPAGPDVLLNNTDLYFSPGTRITLEVGATFLMQRCTLRAITPTESWTGIEVKGDPSLSPTDPGQTRMFIRWNEFRNMEEGIHLAQINFFGMNGGAVLTCEENLFRNNNAAIVVRDYPNFPSAVKINSNSFVTDNTGLPSNDYWFSNGRYIFIQNAFNIGVEGNQFGNISPASTGSYSFRGNGIQIYGGSVLARENIFYRLDRGVWKVPDTYASVAPSNPLFNPTQLRDNIFANNESGVTCQEGPMVIFGNTFKVDNNNVLAQDRYDQGISQRDFQGIRLEQATSSVSKPMNTVNIQNNSFIMHETLPYDPNAETLALIAVRDFGGTQPGDELILRNNFFDFNVPPGGSGGVGNMQYATVALRSRTGEGNYDITCNTFQHVPISGTTNYPIDIFFRDEPLAFGSVGNGAGNLFPDCADVREQISVTGTITADYYEVTGANNLDPTCYFGSVNFPSTNVLNTCAVENPPALIPGSIPPTQYPSSNKMVALTSQTNISLSISPNPLSQSELQVQVSQADGQVRVLDLTGRSLLTRPVTATEFHLDLNALAPGLYLVEFNHANQRTTERLIVR